MLNGKGKLRTQRKSLSLKRSKDKDSTSEKPKSSGVNISKFFLKINESGESRSSYSDQGLEPQTKKQKKENIPKNNEPFGVEDTSIVIDFNTGEEPLNGDVQLSNTDEVLLSPATTDTQSFCHPKKTTLKKLSSSTIPSNSTIDQHPSKNLSLPSKIIKKYSQVERSSAMMDSSMSDDDMVIPPTPPIASTFGNKQFFKRSNTGELKSNAELKTSSYFSSVQPSNPKKYSLSLKSKMKRNNKVVTATPTLNVFSKDRKLCTSMNQGLSSFGMALDESILDKEDATVVGTDPSKNKYQEDTNSNSVKRFSLQNTRKTYKLSRKKKVQAETSELKSTSTKKLGVPSAKNNNSMIDAEIEDGLLLSYGVALQVNCDKDLLDPSVVRDCDVERCERDLAQGQLHGRSLKRFAERGISPLAKRLSTGDTTESNNANFDNTRVDDTTLIAKAEDFELLDTSIIPPSPKDMVSKSTTEQMDSTSSPCDDLGQSNNANFDNTTVDDATLMAEDRQLVETSFVPPSTKHAISKTEEMPAACRSGDDMFDISMNSLNNEELRACDFMQGIVWSPSPKKTATKNESLVLPRKHYMKITNGATKDASSDSDEDGYYGWYLYSDSVTDDTSVDSDLAVQRKKEVCEERYTTKRATKVTSVDSHLAVQLKKEVCEGRYITNNATEVTSVDSHLAVQLKKEVCEKRYTTESATGTKVISVDSHLAVPSKEVCEGRYTTESATGTKVISVDSHLAVPSKEVCEKRYTTESATGTKVISVDSHLAVPSKEVCEKRYTTESATGTKVISVDSHLAVPSKEVCEGRYTTKRATKVASVDSNLAVQHTKEECDCEECCITKSAREVASMDSDLSLQANEECEGCHWCTAKSGTEDTSLTVQAKKEYEETVKQQGYQRFLVLEVCQREITNDVTSRTGGVEKVLRLFDLSINSEQYCQLRDDWKRTEVEHGDIVNIVGEPISADSPYILDNQTERYIIVHPDILVSPTSISSSIRCLRRSILEKHFKTEGQVEVMFLGTLLHSIFDSALIAKDFSKKFVLDETKKVLQNLPNLVELYGLGITERDILSKVEAQATCMAEWSEKYFHNEPHSVHGLIDFKDGATLKANSSENIAVCVSQVVDIEECVWSPKFGLKGKMDVTVEVKINKNPNIMKKNRALYETAVLPLELKTGKLSSKLGSVEHRAQVILYSMFMMDRYPSTMDTSLLLYLKAGHMLGVPAYCHEKRALVMKRNEMTRYLSCSYMETAVQKMPAMLQDQRTCKYCSQAKVCTLYHKSVERGDRESAGMGELFDNMTNHLSADHLEYFAHWNMLISLESKEMKKSDHERDIWCLSGSEREELGYCFSKMVLVSCEAATNPDESGRFVNKFSKQEPKTSQVSFSEMRISKGDYVVVSQDNRLTALATGFLSDVTEEFVSVLLDKNLTKCYHHTNAAKGNALYRIDKAELSTGAVIQWSNLAKLFFTDREQDAKLRRLAVDLEAPTFSSSESLPSQKSEVRNILNDLNSDQKMAISKVLSAQDYALVLGMPGTGKTTTTDCLVRVLRTRRKSILLTSYTHSAVDTILLKLKQSNVDFLRLGSIKKIHPDIQPYALSNAAKHVRTVKELKEFLDTKMVVATTCLGSNHAIFSQRSFDYCIVDEASQITQPVCFGPLRHASIFVLVGDHYQLPPLVLSSEAKEIGMDISLFRRLSESHPQAVVNLEHQYRMNKDIMLISNSLIYQHRLKCGTEEIANSTLTLPNWDSFKTAITEMKVQQKVCCSWLLDVLDSRRPVLFVGTDELPAPEVHTDCNVSNKIEAGFVTSIVHGLIKAGLNANSIGVISPYRHQLEVIKQHLDVETGHVVSEVEINTVDKYQGRDKLCIVVSLVRSNDGGHVGDLLKDWRRVNVALTRAKQKLILLGSKKTLKNNMLFHEMLVLLEKKSWVYNLPNDAWQGKLF